MKYIRFVMQILLIIVVGAWLSYFPGTVEVQCQDYTVKAPLSLVAVGGILLIYAILFGQKMILKLLTFFRYRNTQTALRRHKKLAHLCIEGIASLEFGDDDAFIKSYQSSRRLDSHNPLSEYLSFLHAVNINADEDDWSEVGPASPVKYLVYKFQVEQAFVRHDYYDGLSICCAIIQTRATPWFVKAGVFAAIKLKNFEKAIECLEIALDQNILSKQYDESLSVIIWYQFAQHLGPRQKNYIPYLFKAHRANLKCGNVAACLAAALCESNETSKAEKVLEETWVLNPIYQVAISYCDMGDTALSKAQRAQTLLGMQIGSGIAHIIAIYYCIAAELWGEAQALLTASQEQFLLKMWEADYLEAMIAHNYKKTPEIAYNMLKKSCEYHWLNKWICRYCAHQSLSWQPFCEQCDAFDHIAYNPPKSAHVKIPIFPS